MSKVAITNVRVFDGNQILEPQTVVIDGEFIVEDATGATIVDGKGGVLLPGLIDAHVHLHGDETLKQLTKYGVTTALDMATWPPTLLNSLRDRKGLTDIRSPGVAACAHGSLHCHMPTWPQDDVVETEEDAIRFVNARVAEGADYIKVIADLPGFQQETLNKLVAEAKNHGKVTIAHAAQFPAFHRALAAGVTFITHVPMQKTLDDTILSIMKAQGTIAIPTLSMMETVVRNIPRPGADFAHSKDSVAALHAAGITILAGTDSNDQLGSPAKVKHGDSLHHELELLVDSGLSNLEALRAATSLPAKHFGLNDRGVVEVGKRADLILISANPLEDIKATRQIQRVWCAGIEVAS